MRWNGVRSAKMDGRYNVWWLSNDKFTVRVVVNERGTVVDAADVVWKFVGQPLRNLTVWMNRRPGFRSERISPV